MLALQTPLKVVTHLASHARLASTASWSSSDAGLAQARTPPAQWYFDPAYHALDKQAVFRPSWQISEVEPLPADSFKAARLSASGTEYLLTQQGASSSGLRAFHNVRFPGPARRHPRFVLHAHSMVHCRITQHHPSAGVPPPCCASGQRHRPRGQRLPLHMPLPWLAV